MKALIFSFVVLGLAPVAHSKTLSVSCQDRRGQTVEFASQIANINSPQAIEGLEVNGTSIAALKDVSQLPLFAGSAIRIKIAFGKSLSNSVELNLNNCEDSFRSGGEGVLSKYVGGFAGSERSQLKCTCELK